MAREVVHSVDYRGYTLHETRIASSTSAGPITYTRWDITKRNGMTEEIVDQAINEEQARHKVDRLLDR